MKKKKKPWGGSLPAVGGGWGGLVRGRGGLKAQPVPGKTLKRERGASDLENSNKLQKKMLGASMGENTATNLERKAEKKCRAQGQEQGSNPVDWLLRRMRGKKLSKRGHM